MTGRRPGTRRQIALVASIVALGAGAVVGGNPSRATAADKSASQAKEHVDKASRHFDLDEFQPALDEYKEAYRLKADPALLFNIARCHHKLNQREDALAFYNKYLAKAKAAAKGGPVAREDSVRKWIADLEAPPDAAAPQGGKPGGAIAGTTGGKPGGAIAGTTGGKPGGAIAALHGAVGGAAASSAPEAKRRFTVVAQGGASERTLIRGSREAVEQILAERGHELVPWKSLSDADGALLGSPPKSGDGAWPKATERLKIDQVVLCTIRNAGILVGLAKRQYGLDVVVFDRAGKRTQGFTLEFSQADIGAGVREQLARELK